MTTTNRVANWVHGSLLFVTAVAICGCYDRGPTTRPTAEKHAGEEAKAKPRVTMTSLYQSKWWSVELPDGWYGQQIEILDLLASKQVPGEIRSGSLTKNVGGRLVDLTDADMQDWAKEYAVGATVIAPPSPVRCGDFVGLYHVFQADDEYSRQWLLRNGPLFVQFTHVCDPKEKGTHDAVVNAIIETAKVRK